MYRFTTQIFTSWLMAFFLLVGNYCVAEHPLILEAEALADTYARQALDVSDSLKALEGLRRTKHITEENYLANVRALNRQMEICGEKTACKIEAARDRGRPDPKSIGIFLNPFNLLPYMISVAAVGIPLTLVNVAGYYFLIPASFISEAVSHELKTLTFAPFGYLLGVASADLALRGIVPQFFKLKSRLRGWIAGTPMNQEIMDAFVDRLVEHRFVSTEDAERIRVFPLRLETLKCSDHIRTRRQASN